MECDASKTTINMDIIKEAAMDVELEKSTVNNNIVINNDSTVAPVIIEELDESAINLMDMDINEFVEAKALQIEEVKNVPNYTPSPSCSSNKDIMDTEDQDMLLTADEEDRLTKQFLNGELTFSEYSSRMDQDIDVETVENDNSRYDLKEILR